MGEHTYVIPDDARKLVASGRLDRRLFDVTTLVDFGYDDAHSDAVPLIVTHPAGQAAPRLAGNTRALPSIDGVALAVDKDDAVATWEALTDGDAVRATARGVSRIWLDGKRKAVLDHSAAQIGAPAAWEAGLTGEGVRVAVLDTGVDQTHPDLAGQEVAEQNFSLSPDSVDNVGHGTHVASILAGTGAKSGGKYRGIASGAEILDGKVLDDFGYGSDSDIIAGMEWAVEQDADIVNLSLGGVDTAEVDPLEQAVETLTADHGTLFVIAAGNGVPGDDLASPGSAPSALTVGAVDRENALADFSLTGPTVGDSAIKPDVTAPGVEIVAALHSAGVIAPPVEDGYTALSGTSMATPHVAGAAALIAQQHPDWTGQRIKAALTASATPTPGSSVFEQGSGRIDVARAVTTSVVAEPSSVSMGIQEWPREDDEPVSRTLTYRNLGDADITLALTVDATDPDGNPTDAFSLSANEVTVTAGGTASVTVTGYPSGGPVEGSYSGTVVATSGDSVVRTPVGITLEGPTYDVTVNYIEDPDNPSDQYVTTLIGLEDLSYNDAYHGDSSVTLRVPKGRYLLDHIAGTVDGEGLTRIVRPGVVVDRDQTLDIDLAVAKPISVTTPRPAEVTMAEIDYGVAFENVSFSLGILAAGDLGDIRTAQIGDPLQGLSMTGAVHTNLLGADGAYYALAWFLDRFPTGFTKVVRQRELATVRTDYGPIALSDRGTQFWLPHPASGSAPSMALGYYTEIPSKQTTYVNTDGVRWETEVSILDDDHSEVAWFSAPPRSFRAGGTYDDRFNYPMFGPGLPRSQHQWVSRSGNDIVVAVPLFTDGEGHAGFTNTESGSTKLYLGDELVGESLNAGFGNFYDLPAAAGDYRLTTEATRAAPFDLTTAVSAEWTFRSSAVDNQVALPLNVVRFLPRLDSDGAAPAGKSFSVPLKVQDETGGTHRPTRLAVEVSYDEGKTWQRARIAPGQVAMLDHPAGAGSVSLRASATDRDGNTVRQTVIRAYKLK